MIENKELETIEEIPLAVIESQVRVTNDVVKKIANEEISTLAIVMIVKIHVKQLTTGFANWVDRYIPNCSGQRDHSHQINRMNKWGDRLQSVLQCDKTPKCLDVYPLPTGYKIQESDFGKFFHIISNIFKKINRRLIQVMFTTKSMMVHTTSLKLESFAKKTLHF